MIKHAEDNGISDEFIANRRVDNDSASASAPAPAPAPASPPAPAVATHGVSTPPSPTNSASNTGDTQGLSDDELTSQDALTGTINSPNATNVATLVQGSATNHNINDDANDDDTNNSDSDNDSDVSSNGSSAGRPTTAVRPHLRGLVEKSDLESAFNEWMDKLPEGWIHNGGIPMKIVNLIILLNSETN